MIICLVNFLPIDATTGPNARANAPNDLKIPITVPLWAAVPNSDAIVIIHGTTIAVAKNTIFY